MPVDHGDGLDGTGSVGPIDCLCAFRLELAARLIVALRSEPGDWCEEGATEGLVASKGRGSGGR